MVKAQASGTVGNLSQHDPAMATPPTYVSQQDIEVALRSVAQLIEAYGDKYWPIFERLEQELEARQSRAERLRAALDGYDA